MKIILLITFFSVVFGYCDSDAVHRDKRPGTFSSIRKDTVDFSTKVLPLLKGKCSPCHFPGGKMYEKMPFDDSETILRHESGILKRFRNQPGKDLIRQFILEQNQENQVFPLQGDLHRRDM